MPFNQYVDALYTSRYKEMNIDKDNDGNIFTSLIKE